MFRHMSFGSSNRKAACGISYRSVGRPCAGIRGATRCVEADGTGRLIGLFLYERPRPSPNGGGRREVARTGPRPPVAILVSIVVSLPLFPYNWHLMLHILGAVLFLGNITVTAAWMTWAVGQKDTRVAAFASAGVNRADRWFTSPGMILLLLNGLALTNLAWGGWLGFTTSPNRWIFVGLTLLIVTGALYGAVIRRYQNEMVRVSSEAAQTNAPLPEQFASVFRKWTLWGAIATILPLVALYVMVANPAF